MRERSAEQVRALYDQGLTQADIGRKLGLSKQRIGQIITPPPPCRSKVVVPKPPRRPLVYCIGSREYGWYKIGATVFIEKRFRDIAAGCPFAVELIGTIDSDEPFAAERGLHRLFQTKRLKHEWFLLEPCDLAPFLPIAPLTAR